MQLHLREQYERIRADRFLMAWNVSLLVAIALPLIVFAVARVGGEGEQEQEYQYDMYGNRIHWWQFWKKQQYNNDEEQKDGAPWWCKYRA